MAAHTPAKMRTATSGFQVEVLSAPEELVAARWIEKDAVVVAVFAIAACAIHFLFNGRYGYFRDELYYAACGQHLAWGYVDQAPLIAVVARLTRDLFGNSLRALRVFPALSAGAKILLTGWMVRELGGRRYAQILAALAVLLCPIYLTMDNFLSMNAFEPLFWMLCAAVAMRIVKQNRQKLWLLFGLVAGIGLLNKQSMLFFGLGFFLSLLTTEQRRMLRERWVWLGGLIAFLIFLPNLVWEAVYHWPTLEILENVSRIKNAHVSWLAFIAQQALLVHPLAAPICVLGLWYFLRSREGKPYRFLGWTYLFVLAEFLILRGRIYYLAPIYLMLFAAGAVHTERWIERHDRVWLKQAIIVPLVVGGIVAAPLALPILPLHAEVAYSDFWDVQRIRVEKEPSGKLPQMFADMIGWRRQVAVVAGVFHSLPARERSQAAILTRNYGEAGAVDYFGSKYGLPEAISGHNNYYLWGPRQYTGELVIAVGIPKKQLESLFGQVKLATTIKNSYAVPQENNLPVFICRKPKVPLSQAWPRLKFYG